MATSLFVKPTECSPPWLWTRHIHEHHNAAVNSDGGAVGLTQSPEALRHWMVAGPELARVTSEFEASIGEKTEQASDYQPP